MDEQESRVYDYLKSIGYKETDIVFEPDGNITPDFLLEKEIAVEVRRLNQHSNSNGSTKSLEVDSIPLYQCVSNTLPQFNQRIPGKSYFVFLRYKRPLPKNKKVKQITTRVLESFCQNPCNQKTEIETESNITYVIFPATPKSDTCFLMGGDSDHDRAGWVSQIMEKNIQYCSDEKEGKVKPHRHKYKTWWLILVDYIGYGCDQELLQNEVSISHTWDKLIVIPPNKDKKTIEIQPA